MTDSMDNENIKMTDEATPATEVPAEETAATSTDTAPVEKGKKHKSAAQQVEEVAAQYEEKLAKLQEEINKQNDKYLRMLAEYDNYRKRTATEGEKHRIMGISSAVVARLPVIDSVNRALEVLSGDDKAYEGIQQIKKQFEQSLTKIGVEEIAAQGCDFDPEWHNAVMQEENAEQAGKVIQVFQAGYKYGNYVIRPAMVKVGV